MPNASGTTICERCGARLRLKDHVCEQCGAPVNRGDPFTVIAPPPPPPAYEARSAPSRKLSTLFLSVGAVAVAAVLAFAGVMEYGTHSNLDYTKTMLTSTRGQLAGTRDTLHTTRGQLRNVMTTLNSTQSQLSSAQAQVQQLQQQVTGQQTTISGQQSTISGQTSTIATQRAEIADLNTCLQGVSRALLDINYYNNLQAGINELDSIDAVCTRAEKNLPPG